MKTVKTIVQGIAEYSINQIGNRTYRVSWKNEGTRRINHVDAIFDSVESAEAYIASIANTDALIKQIADNDSVIKIRAMIASTGMSQREFADYLLIPLRTVENWCSGINKCPHYLIALIEYRLTNEGLINSV